MSIFIKNTRILNVEDRVKQFPVGTKIRVVADASGQNITKAGFEGQPAVGDTVLPPATGSVSRYNANGKRTIHRKQAKETRFIRTVMWRWKEWSGRDSVEREAEKDIYRECYPFTDMPPPSVEIMYVEHGGSGLLASPELPVLQGSFEDIKHATNLFLELFGSCELVGADLADVGKIPVKHVNWRFLPPGQHPWERLKQHIQQIVGHLSPDTGLVIWNRQETIKAYAPDELYTGQGGFHGYVAYVFKKRGLVVLESVRVNNAIYVFGKDWQKLSQQTKAEVIAGNQHTARIIHSQEWRDTLAALMNKSAAAE